MGSFQGGAKALKVSYPTILRSVARLEKALGAALFQRRRKGYVLSATGQVALQAARKIEQEVSNLEHNMSQMTSEAEGSIRVGIPEALGVAFFASFFKVFRDVYPKIKIEAAVSTARPGEGSETDDLFLALSGPDRRNVSGVLMGKIGWAIYGRPDLVAGTPEPESLNVFPWIGPAEGLAPALSKWMAKHGLTENVVCQADSIGGCRELSEAGIGVAALPCCLGDASENLAKVAGPVPEMECELWAFTHRDMKDASRVRNLVEFLVEAIKPWLPALRGIYTGEAFPGPGRAGHPRAFGAAGFAESREASPAKPDLQNPPGTGNHEGEVST